MLFSFIFNNSFCYFFQDTVSYAITRDNTGANSLSYFFIERNTGVIFLRQPLLGKGIDQFQVSI